MCPHTIGSASSRVFRAYIQICRSPLGLTANYFLACPFLMANLAVSDACFRPSKDCQPNRQQWLRALPAASARGSPSLTALSLIVLGPFRTSLSATVTGLSVLMYDSLSRKQLNNRNFEGYIALWQEISGEYNMKTYAPMSYTFPKLHSNFKIAIALVLQNNIMYA